MVARRRLLAMGLSQEVELCFGIGQKFIRPFQGSLLEKSSIRLDQTLQPALYHSARRFKRLSPN